MNRIKILKMLLYPIRSLFGSGIGNIKILYYIFMRVVSLIIKKQHIVVEANDCKLGMTIGGDRGFDALAGGLILGKGYEVKTTELFKSLVKESMNVIDVGAHVGYYTILASKLVGKKGNVWAFEPEPRNFENLANNINLNECQNVVVTQTAIGDKVGKAKLYISASLSGECSLVEMKERPKTYIDVKVKTLDGMFNGQVDVVKIDVDGGEIAVVSGAEKLLKRSNQVKVFTEFWKLGLESSGHSCASYWGKLVEYGFKYIYLIDEKRQKVQLVSLCGVLEYLQKTEGVNLLCSKEIL